MLKKYFRIDGRIKRAKLLQVLVLAALFVLGAWFIDERYLSPNLCYINEDWICYLPGEVRDGFKLEHLAGLLVALPVIGAMIRRLHDHDKSGKWLLIAFTGIGILPLIYWFLMNGQKEKNQYN